MIELMLIDDTLPESQAVTFEFLETAVSSWLDSWGSGQMHISLTTPRQVQTIFKLIYAEYNDKIKRSPLSASSR